MLFNRQSILRYKDVIRYGTDGRENFRTGLRHLHVHLFFYQIVARWTADVVT